MQLPDSKYLKFFKEYGASPDSELVGDILIVERIVFPEKKTRSGLIITDSRKVQVTGLTSEVPQFFRVLLVGRGYYDDVTKKDVPLDIVPGDIILTAMASVKVYSSLPLLETTDSDIIGMTRHGDIQWRWKGEEAFLRFFESLNGALTG